MTDRDLDALDPRDVAAWLRRHPNFLESHPDVALNLVVPRAEGQATSLASYQVDVLRDKNRELNRRLQELFANAQDNERLTVRTHQLTLALMRQGSRADTLAAMVAVLSEDFQGEIVRVVTHEAAPELAAVDWLQVVSPLAAVMEPFREFQSVGEPLCGRLRPEKLDLLFGPLQAEVQSAALLSLGRHGLLAIGSREPNRFYPGMGTLFLRLMSEALVTALERFDAR